MGQPPCISSYGVQPPGDHTLPRPAPPALATAGALQRGVRGPGVVLPPTVQVTTQVGGRLLLGVVAVGTIAQATLDIGREPLTWQHLVGAGAIVRHLGGSPVLETVRLVAGQEPVEVGPGAVGPGDLAAAQGRRHDVAARSATVPILLTIVTHAKTEMRPF